MLGLDKSDTRQTAVRAALTSYQAERGLFRPVTLDDVIKFKSGRLKGIFLREGWSDVEPDGVWSLGKRATLDILCPRDVGVEVVVAIAFRAFVTAEHSQQVEISAGGKRLRVVQISPGDHRLHVVYQSVPVQNERVSLELCLPRACSPQSLFVGDDNRELAIKLTSLQALAPSRDCVVEAVPDVVYHGASVFSSVPVQVSHGLERPLPEANEGMYRREDDRDAIDLNLSEAVGFGFAALGFWAEETGGRWTRSHEARLVLPLDGLANSSAKLDVYFSLRPYAPLARGQSIIISVMNRSAKYKFSQGDGNQYLVCLPGVERVGSETLKILVRTETLTSPHSLAGEGDPRIIGVQVSRVRVQPARHGLPSWSRHHKLARARPSIMHSVRAKWDRRLYGSSDKIGDAVSSIIEHFDGRLLDVSGRISRLVEDISLTKQDLSDSIDGVRRDNVHLHEDLYSRVNADISVAIKDTSKIQGDVRTIHDLVGILDARQQSERLALGAVCDEVRDLRSYASSDLQAAIISAVSQLFEELRTINSQALEASSDKVVKDITDYGKQAISTLLSESHTKQEASFNSLLDRIIAGFSDHSRSAVSHLFDESQVRHEENLKGILDKILGEISGHTSRSVSTLLEDARDRQNESFRDLSEEIQKTIALHSERQVQWDDLAQAVAGRMSAELDDLQVHKAEIQVLVEGLHSKVDATVRRHSIRYNETTEAVRTDYGYVLVPNNDLPLILHIMSIAIHGYEWGTSHVMKTVVAEGMHVADVGANVGMHTLLLARLVGENGKVYAVEPLADLAANLKLAMALNGFYRRVSVINLAAGDVAGQALINRGLTSSHSSFFPLDDELKSGSEMVEIATLDDAIPGRLDFLKIDAEGYELNILEGASRHLSNPDIVVVAEFANSHVERAGGESEAWFAAMHRRGFSCFLIATEPGGNVLSRLADVAFFEDGNYLMVRRGSRHWSNLISLSSAALQ